MEIISTIVVCTRCDAVYKRPLLAVGQVAFCSACNTVVWRSAPSSIDGWLALSLSAAIMFVLANMFPVMSIGVQNFQNQVTLWGATTSLVRGIWAPLAIPAVIVTILAPFVQITLLIWVLVFAWSGRKAPGFRRVMKILMAIQPWSMTEVAMLGVIVAGIKLSSMAYVSFGTGTWTMLALTALTAFTTKRDLQWLWNVFDPHISQTVGSTP